MIKQLSRGLANPSSENLKKGGKKSDGTSGRQCVSLKIRAKRSFI